jgi:predicted lactoylglutathione lyase
MNKMIFVNLPVSDLARSIAFYEAIGATSDPHFRDATTQMLRFSEEICVMVMTHERFSGFTPRRIPNAHETAQVLLALSAESRGEVDATTDKAGASGGTADPNPRQDHGFMYGRSFADPDGHIWELAWMDMEAAMASGGGNNEAPA